MNRDKREPEYPTELESQFILRLPEEPAKLLKEILETGDNLKNRLTIKVDNDMRHGEVCLDHWLMHAKIIDLPTIIESLKTIDNKSFYKAADICQMMICKEGPEEPSTEEECPVKNKKKDPNKVDKKFLYPHGITPPTKNVRKRRFRKTLKKKSAEAPDIEKEVKRLLRADNEAENITWEVITETDDEQLSKPEPPPPVAVKVEKKGKQKSKANVASVAKNPDTSNVVDIFGGAVSDSDLEEDSTKVDVENSKRLLYESRKSDKKSKHAKNVQRGRKNLPITFETDMYINSPKPSTSTPSTSGIKSGALSSEDDGDYSRDMSKDNMSSRIEQLGAELEELKQRKQRTQHEISGLENAALRQRFQDILHNLNKDILYKEMEYQGLITLQNSDDI